MNEIVTLAAMLLAQHYSRAKQEAQYPEEIGHLACLVDHSLLDSVDIYPLHVHMRLLAGPSQRNHIDCVTALYESVAVLLYACVAFVEGVGNHCDFHRYDPALHGWGRRS